MNIDWIQKDLLVASKAIEQPVNKVSKSFVSS